MNRRHFRQERPGGLWLPERRIIRPRAGTIFIGGTSEPATKAFADSDQSTTNDTSYSFATQSIGTAAADRHVLVIASWITSAATVSCTALTVGGVTADAVIAVEAATRGITMRIAAVPTGTTATVAVTLDGTALNCGIGLWAVYGLESTTAVDTDSATISSTTLSFNSMATAAEGVAFWGMVENTGLQDTTWTTASERWSNPFGDDGVHSGADASTTGANLAPTAASSNSNLKTGVGASFR